MPKVLLIVALWCYSLVLSAQQYGIPLIKNYEPRVYNASPQNWEILQIETGEILVANQYGLVTYNGLNWKLYEEELNYVTKCIKRYDNSIFIGSENDIFTIKTDSVGGLAFESVLPPMPDSLMEFGIVEDIILEGNQFVFNSEDFIFHFSENGLNWAYNEDRIYDIYLIKNTVFASVEGQGLMRLDDGKLIPSNAYKYFIENPVVDIWNADKLYLALTENGTLYQMNLDQYGFIRAVKPYQTEVDDILAKNPVDDIWRINDSLTGVATQDNGLLIFKDWNTVSAHLTLDAGLQDELVHDIYQDNYGSIWLALANGITKVDLSYPVRVFDTRNGLEGTVEDIAQFKDQLLVATHAGMFAKNGGEFVSTYPEQIWDIQPFYHQKDSLLLIATNDNISEIKADGKVDQVLECYPWKMFQLQDPKNTILVGTDPGLIALRYENGNWIIGQDNLNVNSPINNFNETEEGVYLGSRFNEPYSFQNLAWIGDSTDYKNLILYDNSTGIPEGEMNVFSWQGKNYIGSYGAYFHEIETDSFVLDTFSGLDRDALFHRVLNNKDKELWCITLVGNYFQFGYVNEIKQWNYRLFNPIAKDIVHSIHIPDSQHVLFGGAGGIYQYQRNTAFDHKRTYSSLITEVAVLEDSVIHRGYWLNDSSEFTTQQPDDAVPEFHYLTNEIAFRFSSPTFGSEEDIRYSYWLEGNNKKWSKWTSEHKKEYTNLPPGTYTFNIKAKNVFEEESAVTSYRFIIHKPWFQTGWYYTLQTAILLLLVFLTVFLNRSGNPSPFSSVIAFVTIITVFEFIIMTVEPIFMEYTGEIPVFNLIMNVLMAASLAPVEKLIRTYLARKKE